MIDAKTLEYDFKEEELGFEEPFKQPEIPLNLGEKFSLGLVALGLLAFVVQLLGAPIKGTWIGLFLAFSLKVCLISCSNLSENSGSKLASCRLSST